MKIGQKLREERNLSQGDIQHKTGLLRCYTSRVENGFTVPNIETLEKLARALEIPLYHFFTDGEKVKMLEVPTIKTASAWGVDGAHRREIVSLPKPYLEWMIAIRDFFSISRRKWHAANQKSNRPHSGGLHINNTSLLSIVLHD
jgi:transcriptional regulator with XRE-family HTH domain